MRKLLEMLIVEEPEIRVLLDVGAQILDLSNRQVAEAWLDLTAQHNVTGVIYFDQEDKLMVLSRNGMSLPLLSSPFNRQLDQCITYLDHAHTRGTDIKFPHNYRAAVTLGPKVTKDHLVQDWSPTEPMIDRLYADA
ncbi:hypothetical protein JVU11DRAFT_8504 [Chiua virens]|nr:hypothetical protein JVU11DRAFT_8504 [Chiua virens]